MKKSGKTKTLRLLLVGIGVLSLGIGVVGIILPVLPTTPFIFVSGVCFAKSSNRLHRWLLTSKLTKKTYERILKKQGISRRMKLGILGFAWTMLILAAVFLAKGTFMRIFLPAIGVLKTVLFFTVIKTAQREDQTNSIFFNRQRRIKDIGMRG